VHHVRVTLNKGEPRFNPKIVTDKAIGRHPDFKLAYVTLKGGEIFEYPNVDPNMGDEEDKLEERAQQREQAAKLSEYSKQQNWKKKFGGPDWFS